MKAGKQKRLKTLSDRCGESTQNHPDCQNEMQHILPTASKRGWDKGPKIFAIAHVANHTYISQYKHYCDTFHKLALLNQEVKLSMVMHLGNGKKKKNSWNLEMFYIQRHLGSVKGGIQIPFLMMVLCN